MHSEIKKYFPTTYVVYETKSLIKINYLLCRKNKQQNIRNKACGGGAYGKVTKNKRRLFRTVSKQERLADKVKIIPIAYGSYDYTLTLHDWVMRW